MQNTKMNSEAFDWLDSFSASCGTPKKKMNEKMEKKANRVCLLILLRANYVGLGLAVGRLSATESAAAALALRSSRTAKYERELAPPPLPPAEPYEEVEKAGLERPRLSIGSFLTLTGESLLLPLAGGDELLEPPLSVKFSGASCRLFSSLCKLLAVS